MTLHHRGYRAKFLLIENIKALLDARGVDQEALAMWCGHSPPWLSKILSGERGVKIADLDKIADFFGLTVAQLLTHGISALTERRKAERRTTKDRRTGKDRRGHRAAVHPRMSPHFKPRDSDDGNAA